MGRRSEMLRAELAVADLEDELVAAKKAGTVTHEQKLALREARRRFREARARTAPEPGEARPGTVETGTTVGG